MDKFIDRTRMVFVRRRLLNRLRRLRPDPKTGIYDVRLDALEQRLVAELGVELPPPTAPVRG